MLFEFLTEFVFFWSKRNYRNANMKWNWFKYSSVSNQIKSKIFKHLIGFEKFFNSKILFGFALIFVKNPNQTKSNKKKRSGNVLFVSLSSRKSEIPHKNSRLFGTACEMVLSIDVWVYRIVANSGYLLTD